MSQQRSFWNCENGRKIQKRHAEGTEGTKAQCERGRSVVGDRFVCATAMRGRVGFGRHWRRGIGISDASERAASERDCDARCAASTHIITRITIHRHIHGTRHTQSPHERHTISPHRQTHGIRALKCCAAHIWCWPTPVLTMRSSGSARADGVTLRSTSCSTMTSPDKHTHTHTHTRAHTATEQSTARDAPETPPRLRFRRAASG